MNHELKLTRETPVIIQGITGHQGRIHSLAMKQFGSNIVAGVSPGKTGVSEDGTPVLETVQECVQEFGAEASVIFVPAPHAKEAAFEALEAGIRTLVMVSEHVPPLDTVRIAQYARSLGATFIGPNSPGIAIPGNHQAWHHAKFHIHGRAGGCGLQKRHPDVRSGPVPH